MLEDICVNGQYKFKQAKVLVVGAGGLGCPIIQYLAASGVGTLGIVDFDRIEIHNLHRQILYTTADIGQFKVDVAAMRVQAINPHVSCRTFNEHLSEINATEILQQFDLIIDGCDNFGTRYLVNDVCVELGKPLIYGSIQNYEAQMLVFNGNGQKNLRSIFPEAPSDEDSPSCTLNGVLGIVPGILGLYMANAALQMILGIYKQEDFLIFDLKEFGIQRLSF